MELESGPEGWLGGVRPMLLIIQVPVVPTSWILRISFGSLAKLQVIQSHLLHFLPRSFFPSAWTHFPPLISSRPRPSRLR